MAKYYPSLLEAVRTVDQSLQKLESLKGGNGSIGSELEYLGSF